MNFRCNFSNGIQVGTMRKISFSRWTKNTPRRLNEITAACHTSPTRDTIFPNNNRKRLIWIDLRRHNTVKPMDYGTLTIIYFIAIARIETNTNGSLLTWRKRKKNDVVRQTANRQCYIARSYTRFKHYPRENTKINRIK